MITEESLAAISGNVIAWISVDDTTINYPVVQGKDNMEFLSKDAEGKDSAAGSIFLDSRNSPDFSDPYSILYGHHMAQGLMFGALDAFADPDYLESHREGTLSIKDREIPFRIAAFLVVPAGCDEVFLPDLQMNRGAYYALHAEQYMPEDMTEHLLALTTCRDSLAAERTVLIAALEG